jgi:GT2 family glycosyltransferase
LASVFDSTKRVGFEVIVVDNGSTDGSVAAVKKNFPSVRVIENGENLGFSKANNRGISQGTGRYCLLLNNDTIAKAGAFDHLVEFMDKNPSCGASGPRLLNEDGSVQRQGGFLGSPFWNASVPRPVQFVTGACFMVRREAISKAGLLDENLYFYNEDLDWCRRIRGAGWKIFFVPQAEVIHLGGYSTRREISRTMFVEGFRGGLYFCRKHYGLIAYQIYRVALALLFPAVLLLLLLSLPLSGAKKFLDKASAYFDVFKIALFGPIEYPWNETKS